jgi:hypothetical protein
MCMCMYENGASSKPTQCIQTCAKADAIHRSYVTANSCALKLVFLGTPASCLALLSLLNTPVASCQHQTTALHSALSAARIVHYQHVCCSVLLLAIRALAKLLLSAITCTQTTAASAMRVTRVCNCSLYTKKLVHFECHCATLLTLPSHMSCYFYDITVCFL